MTNWRTSVFGTLTLLAAYLTQFPELLDSLLDPALAKKIAALSALATGFLTFANAKDRQVSGNGTFANPTVVATGGGMSGRLMTFMPLAGLCAGSLAWLGVLWAPVLLSGCATDAATGRRTLSPQARQAGENTLAVLGAAVEGAALASANNVQGQLVNGSAASGEVDAAALEASAISGAISGAAAGLRQLQSTRRAAQPAAVQGVIAAQSGSPALAAQMAPQVAALVATAVQQGAAPDAANEAAARALDLAARAAQAPRP